MPGFKFSVHTRPEAVAKVQAKLVLVRVDLLGVGTDENEPGENKP
jgi:hypothetical protein